MKNKIRLIKFILLSLIFTIFTFGQVNNLQAQTAVKAFPTAEGYGANALGGRGGSVIEVTNLNDSGSGSLRNCVENTGPRTCIFRISGTIVLNDDLRIGANNSYLTIAGQTAPGGGITLKNYELVIHGGAHDIVVRFIRSRPGLDAVPLEGKDTNAILIYGDSHTITTRNIIIDHCEAMWSTDQNGPDSYGNVSDVTVQWSISAEPTISGHSGDPSTPHNLNMLIGAEGGPGVPSVNRISYHHNLLTNAAGRNPLIGRYAYPGDSTFTPTLVDWRNNVVYNWGYENYGNVSTSFNDGPSIDAWTASPSSVQNVNIIGNRFIKGPNSSGNNGIFFINHFSKLYLRDNWGPLGVFDGFAVGVDFWNNGPFYSPWTSNSDFLHYYNGAPANEFDPTNLPTTHWNAVANSEFSVAPVTTESSSNVLDDVLNNVGDTKPARDSVASRIVNEVRTGTGGFGMGTCERPSTNYSNYILNKNPCTYPTLVSTTPPTDTDHDGMPDSWESSHGLNPNNISDGSSISSNGYTNLENYINELAGDSTGVINPPPPTPTPPSPSPTPSGYIPQSQMSIVSANNLDIDALVILDGDTDTNWPAYPPFPQDVVISLGGTYNVTGFTYLQTWSVPVVGYKFFVSVDGSSWGNAVSSGSMPSNGQINFTGKTGRFVKYQITDCGVGRTYCYTAELNVAGSQPSPLAGDLNLDHIVNSLDWSLMNSKWFKSDATADLNKDGIVNAIDFSLLNANWFKTW